MKHTLMKKNKIEFGDQIFARILMKGRTLVEFMINRVADMTELIGELRHLTYGVRGLATLQIRNKSKGWSLERPLMLYASDASGAVMRVARGGSAYGTAMRVARGGSAYCSDSLFSERRVAPHSMPFPWETH